MITFGYMVCKKVDFYCVCGLTLWVQVPLPAGKTLQNLRICKAFFISWPQWKLSGGRIYGSIVERGAVYG